MFGTNRICRAKTANKIIDDVALSVLLATLMLPLGNLTADEMWLGEWLQLNNPRAKKYLASLGPNDIGKEVAGVELSDGTTVLNGYRFLGSPVGIGKGIHMYLFSYQQKGYAYVWIETTGEKLILPDCSLSEPGMAGRGTYVLSGDVYTWKYVRPGDGVVYNVCPEPSWLAAIGKD